MSCPNSSSFFFHRPDFIFRNPDQRIISFPGNRNAISASIYFSFRERNIISLDKSPFGSFVFEPETRKTDLAATIQSVVEWAESNDIEGIVIRCFPQIYSGDQSKLTEEVLQERGFTIKYKDITQVIRIETGKDIPINVDRRRRLKKCKEEGFTFRELSRAELPDAYALFTESREQKGYPVTMTLKELAAMFERFPTHYLLFGAFDKARLIAASVSIVVNEAILYCFYLGDSLAYRQYSPVTLLVSDIYDFAANHRFKWIDLGLSTNKGVLNEGLYSFKKSFGCVDSYKLTFEKRV